MKVFESVEQCSPEWFSLRRGIPTASEFGRIITAKKGEYATGAESYMEELIAESLGWTDPFKGNIHTERGNRVEPIARDWLAFHHGCNVQEVGFILSDCGRYGGSPDGLIDGAIPCEIKAPDLPTFISWKRAGVLPYDHRIQCHGHMILAESKNCLFVAYPEHDALDPLVIDVPRDSFTSTVETHVKTFCDRLESLRREILGENYSRYFPTK
jgi:hypothetical protein